MTVTTEPRFVGAYLRNFVTHWDGTGTPHFIWDLPVVHGIRLPGPDAVVLKCIGGGNTPGPAAHPYDSTRGTR